MSALDDRDSDLSLDRMPGLWAVLDHEGTVRHATPAVLAYSGLPTAELRYWSANGFVHPDDVSLAQTLRAAAARSGRPYDTEHRLRRFDHVYRWFRISVSPIRGADGQIARWYVLMTDVDALVRAGAESHERTDGRCTPDRRAFG